MDLSAGMWNEGGTSSEHLRGAPVCRTTKRKQANTQYSGEGGAVTGGRQCWTRPVFKCHAAARSLLRHLVCDDDDDDDGGGGGGGGYGDRSIRRHDNQPFNCSFSHLDTDA